MQNARNIFRKTGETRARRGITVRRKWARLQNPNKVQGLRGAGREGDEESWDPRSCPWAFCRRFILWRLVEGTSWDTKVTSMTVDTNKTQGWQQVLIGSLHSDGQNSLPPPIHSYPFLHFKHRMSAARQVTGNFTRENVLCMLSFVGVLSNIAVSLP